MYSTSSSSSQHSTPPSTTTTTNNNNNTNNLTRYDSAPTSFLSTVAETVSGLGLGLPHHNHNQQQQFYSGSRDSLAPESTHLQHQHQHQHHHSESRNTLTLLHENSYDNSPVKGAGTTTAASNNLIRHSSSPANFLHQLTSDLGYCNSNQGGSVNGHNLSRLGTQLSFTKQDHHSLSQISELNGCGGMLEGMSSHDNNNNNNSHTTLKRASTSSSSQPRSSSGFSLSAWEDSNDGFSFSGPSTKRNKSINDDILNGLVSMESQDIAFEMTSMDRLMQIPQDSVPCKIRAKRGFATHPRSIAERERRTRISGKLKKLQDLVPNMDKQTSYADMLDLAVQHIKGLQNEVQKLNGELDRCTCGCKENVQH